MQGGVGYLDAADAHGAQPRVGVDAARASDVDQDLLDDGRGFLGRELPGDRPARLASDDAQVGLQAQVVDLDDDAVHLEGLRVAALGPALAGGERVVDTVVMRRFGCRWQAELREPAERFPVRVGRGSVVAPAELIDADAERARRRNRRILLTHRAGGGVARVGVERERGAAFFAAAVVLGRDLRVHGVEAHLGHEDLAADLEERRRAAGELVWYRVDRAQVGGHILACAAVASSRRLDEPSALVDQRDGQPVDLGFADEGPLLAVKQVGGALVPGAQLVGVEGVAQREHPQPMLDDGEGSSRRRAHGLSGAVGRDELGEVGLQALELAEELIVFRVRDFGRVEHVVEVIVTQDLGAQQLDAVARGDDLGVAGA